MSGQTRYYEAFGYWRTLDDWAWHSQVARRTIENRLRAGLPLEVAVNVPAQQHVDPGARAGGPNSWTWFALDFEDDPWAKAFVKRYPGGATLDVVGDALGMTRERVRQVEEQIFRKLRASGIAELDELLACMEAA